jgi:RNA polymerase sigma-70 factor, ECF subfamily
MSSLVHLHTQASPDCRGRVKTSVHGPGQALLRSRQTPQAFVEFYDELAPKVLRFFLRRTWDGHDSLELTSETFAKAFEKRADFRGRSNEQAAGWLWSIARNELGAYWRSRALALNANTRLGLLQLETSEEDMLRTEEVAVAEAAREDLQTALGELPSGQRVVIELSVLDGLDHAEIARRLNVSNQVVRTRLSRGLRSLARSETLSDSVL